MPKSRPPYPPEFRQRIIRKGRTPESLAEQFEPSAQAIRNWLAQAERDAGQGSDGLATDEREELRRLRRENKTLREELEILKKGRGLGLPRRPARSRPRIRVRDGAPGHPSHRHAVPCPGGLSQRVLCVAAAAALGARPGRRHPGRPDPGDSWLLPRDLRGAPRARRVGRRRRARRPQTRRPSDAGRRRAGREPPEAPLHAAPGFCASTRGTGRPKPPALLDEPSVGAGNGRRPLSGAACRSTPDTRALSRRSLQLRN
jgi:transposase